MLSASRAISMRRMLGHPNSAASANSIADMMSTTCSSYGALLDADSERNFFCGIDVELITPLLALNAVTYLNRRNNGKRLMDLVLRKTLGCSMNAWRIFFECDFQYFEKLNRFAYGGDALFRHRHIDMCMQIGHCIDDRAQSFH